MKKKFQTSFIFLLTLFSLNFVSAAFNYYGGFSFRNLFYGVNSSTIAFFAFFTIIFAFVFTGVSRMLKDSHGNPNTGTALAVSLAFTFLTTYWVSRSRFDFEYYIFRLESSGLLWIIIPAIIILAIWLIVSKFGRRGRRRRRRRRLRRWSSV
jgi:fucose 4-O-acetylase-like acetyltransferase